MIIIIGFNFISSSHNNQKIVLFLLLLTLFSFINILIF